MTRFGAAAWVLLVLAAASVAMPGSQFAHAHELVREGTAVTLPGADNAAKTADHYLRDVIIRLLGAAISIGGLASTQKSIGGGLTGFASGIGIIFVPDMIGSGAESAAAATSLAFVAETPFAAWAQWASVVLGEACLVMMALVGYRQWRRQTA